MPNKDLLLGFDILHQTKNVHITSFGLHYKSMIKPFTKILKIYSLANSPPSYQAITDQILKFYPENHSLFTHPNPLWKNPKMAIINLDPTLHKSYSTFSKVTLQKGKSNNFLESSITSVISCHMSTTIPVSCLAF